MKIDIADKLGQLFLRVQASKETSQPCFMIELGSICQDACGTLFFSYCSCTCMS